MSIKIRVFDYVLRSNDLSVAADRCHAIISNPSLPQTVRCELAYSCAQSLVALITTGNKQLYDAAVADVEKCVSERAKSTDKCELAKAYIACAKMKALEIILYYAASARG